MRRRHGIGNITEERWNTRRANSADSVHRPFQCVSIKCHVGEGGVGGGGAETQQRNRCILRTASGERPMYGVKLDVVNREHQRLIFAAWRLVLPMTPKRIILPVKPWQSEKSEEEKERVWTWGLFTLDPYLRYSCAT